MAVEVEGIVEGIVSGPLASQLWSSLVEGDESSYL